MKTINLADEIYFECFSCDFDNGILYWKERPISHFRTAHGMRIFNSQHANKPILYKNNDGYIGLAINNKQMKAHRIIYFLFYRKWPDGEIDHINGIRDDNRICNLRDASKEHNQQNQRKPRSDNKSGFLGVSYRKDTGMYRATIALNGVKKNIGSFSTPEIAHQAYLQEKRKIHKGCTI